MLLAYIFNIYIYICASRCEIRAFVNRTKDRTPVAPRAARADNKKRSRVRLRVAPRYSKDFEDGRTSEKNRLEERVTEREVHLLK